MSEVKSRTALALVLSGVFLAGAAAGVVFRGRDRSGLPKEDGAAVFGVVGPDGSLLSSWADVRASSSRRSLSLVQGRSSRPQVLVFPQAGSWPALSVPSGWSVAWLDGGGKVLELQVSLGQPLVPKVNQVLAILTVPADSASRGGLVVSKRVLWSDSTAEGACLD